MNAGLLFCNDALSHCGLLLGEVHLPPLLWPEYDVVDIVAVVLLILTDTLTQIKAATSTPFVSTLTLEAYQTTHALLT